MSVIAPDLRFLSILWLHGLQHPRIPCPSPTPGVYPNSCPLSRWCHPTILSSLLLPSTFPSIRVFSSESAFRKKWPKCWSFSISISQPPMNIQDWYPLGLTGLISLHSEGLSRVFSNTTVKNISSSAFSLLYGPTPTSRHDYWKNHSFD